MMEYDLVLVQSDGGAAFWIFFTVYAVQSLMLYFFAGRTFGKRRRSYNYLTVTLCALAEAAGTAFALAEAMEYWLNWILVFLAAMMWRTLALHVFFADDFGCKTAYVLLTRTVFALADMLAGMICFTADKGVYFNRKNIMHTIMWDNTGVYRLTFCVCLAVGELVLLLLLCRQFTRIVMTCSKKDLYALNYVSVILCAASLLVSVFCYDFPVSKVYVAPPFAAALLAAALAGIIVLLRFFPALCRRFRSNAEKLVLESADGELRNEGALSVRQMQKLRHDVKNNIVTISALIDNGDSAEAKRLLGELGERITSALGGESATGIAAIDTTLSAKAALCGERGVTLDLRAEPLPETKIPPIDLSSAVSNILDNAIEAAERCPEPVITLRIFKYKMYLAIVCENPVSAPPRTVGGRLVTTKEDSGGHGCGIEIVSEICSRNNGKFRFEFTDKTFKAAAFLEI